MNPLLGLLLKATLLLCAAWGVTQALRRRSAAARHLVWLLAISGTLLLPISTSLAPELPLRILHSTPPSVRLGEGSSDQQAAGTNRTTTLSAEVVSGQSRPVSGTAATRQVWLSPDLGDLLLALWLSGSLFVLGWCALGHFGLARLVRKATPLSEAEWNALGETVARQSGLRAPVRLFRSAAIGSPVIWGLRPIVLLPTDALSWTAERRRVVLAHELAHAVRGDYLAQLVACLACALFWFHPLVWLAARRLRLESERACDDQVLLRGTQGAEYAGHLLEVARRSRALRLEGMVAIGMARPSHLEGRLLSVLDEKRRRQAPPSRLRRVAWAGLLLLVFPLSALRTAPRLPLPATPPPDAGLPIANPTPSDSSFERELPASSGEELNLELESGGTVVLRAWDEPRVRLRAVLAGPSWRDTRVSLERSPRGVRLHSWQEARSGTSSTSHSFEFMVPRRFDVELNSAGGAVTIVGLQGEFHGQTGGGALVIERATGRAELSTGGGDIRVADSDLRGLVSTGGGEVLLSKVRGSLRGSSGGGSVISRESGREESGSLEDVRVEGHRIRIEKERAKEVEKVEKLEQEQRGKEQQKEIEKRRTEAQKELDKLRSKELKEPKEFVKESAKPELESGALRIKKAGGAILLETAPEGASLSTGGGHIEVGESAGFVEASTGGGNITIGPLAGSVRAGTGAGNVDIVIVDSDGAEHSVDIESGSGSVTLTLPADFSGRFELETAYTESFGRRTRIASDWRLAQEETSRWDDRAGSPRKYVRASGGSGGGGGLVRVRIVNGDITIRRGRS